MNDIKRRTALKIMGSTALIPFVPAIPFKEKSFTEERVIIDAHREWVIKKEKDCKFDFSLQRQGLNGRSP